MHNIDLGVSQAAVDGLSANALRAQITAMASFNPDPSNHAMSKKCTKLTQCSSHRSAPKFSMGGRTGEGGLGRMSSCPGPGKYGVPSVEQKYNTLPRVTFGTGEQRVGGKKKYDGPGAIPGPGAYTPFDPNQTTPKFGFGTGPRIPKSRPEQAPPPGTYESHGSTLSKRDCGMASRQTGGRAMSVPGPGAYSEDINPTREKAPSVGMGSGLRTDAFKDQRLPGPGAYDSKTMLCTNPIAKGSCSFTFKSRRRPVKADATPGPIFAPYSQFE